MKKKIDTAKHAATIETPTRKNLKARALAGLTSGCLVLALCPAAAMAAPMEQGGMQMAQAPSAMQQGPMGGQYAD